MAVHQRAAVLGRDVAGAKHRIRALANKGHHETGQIFRVVLHVGVMDDAHVACCVIPRGPDGRALALVFRVADEVDALILPCQAFEDLATSVGAAVVDDDDLEA